MPVQIAGEVRNFHPEALGLTEGECKSLDTAAQYAVASANLAMQDAGLTNLLTEEEQDHIGVAIGTAMACVDAAEILWTAYTDTGAHPPRIPGENFVLPMQLNTHASAAAIASHHQLHGPCFALPTACSAGADAIGEAFWAIQNGYADRMLAGGSDSAISRVGVGVFSNIGALSRRNEEPDRASRPYERDRDGFVLAEGAGVLVLEEREAALARSAHIYAEVITFNSNSSSYHMTSLPENGMPLQQLLRQALRDAQISVLATWYIRSQWHREKPSINEKRETNGGPGGECHLDKGCRVGA